MNLPSVGSVKFSQQDPLPGSKFEPAILNRDAEAVPDNQGAQVGISVLSGAPGKQRIVVFILDTARNQLLEERCHIRDKRTFNLVQKQTRGRVER